MAYLKTNEEKRISESIRRALEQNEITHHTYELCGRLYFSHKKVGLTFYGWFFCVRKNKPFYLGKNLDGDVLYKIASLDEFLNSTLVPAMVKNLVRMNIEYFKDTT